MAHYRNQFLAIGLALLALGFSGCSDDDSPTSPNGSTSVMPLAIGNYWVFDMTMFQNDIQISNRTDTLIHIDTTFNYGGFVWFGEKGDSSFNRNGDEGVWNIDMVGDTMGTPYLVYKKNATVGETWTYQEDGQTVTIHVVSINATATTPAGTYAGCHQYRATYSGGDTPMVSWLKAGVGPVMMQSEENGYRMDVKLRSLHI